MTSSNNESRRPVSKRPTTATKTRSKTTAQNSHSKGKSAPRSRAKKSSKSRSWIRKLIKITIQLTVLLFIFLAGYGFYLDQKITARFDQGIWNLPSMVFGRTMVLAPDSPYTLEQIKTELNLTQYSQVTKPTTPGQFSISKTAIELFRRGFAFDNGYEGERHIRIDFIDGKINKITDLTNRKLLGFLRMEPKLLGMISGDSSEKRIFMPRELFPEQLIDILLVTEDRDFYKHHGVRPLTILRALVKNIMSGRMVQGGSTLTQQLAKNIFLTRERTYTRKLKEAYISLLLERRYSKDHLLEAYLNEIYLGQDGKNDIHGFPLAAQFYFNKPIQELTLEQLAMLIGIVKGPSYYNPWKAPERVKERRNLVLRMLSEQNPPVIDRATYLKAAAKPLGVQARGQIAKTQPAYLQLLNREIIEKVSSEVMKKGVRIFSTLDPLSQQALEQASIATSPALVKRAGSEQLQMGAVVADRQTGEVRAIIGGRDPKVFGFNRGVDIQRQVGSSIKPAVYLTALMEPNHFTLATSLEDRPIDINGWSPKNYENSFLGSVPLMIGLAKSYNIPTVNLGMSVGLDKVAKNIEQLVPTVKTSRLPSMLLGAVDMSPLQLVEMYQPIANRGKKAELTTLSSVVSPEGRLLYQQLPSVKQVIPEQAAWLTLYAMQRVITEGTGRILQKEYSWAHLAGKTGTTNNNVDSWFTGIDQKEVVSIWVGRDDNQPSKLTGSSGGLVVYRNYIQRRGVAALEVPRPPEITTNKYNLINSEYVMDCNGLIKLPVWDLYKTQQTHCQNRKSTAQPVQKAKNRNLFDKLFN